MKKFKALQKVFAITTVFTVMCGMGLSSLAFEVESNPDSPTDPDYDRTSISINKVIKADPDAVIPATSFSFNAEKIGIGENTADYIIEDMPTISFSDASTSGSQKTVETGTRYNNEQVENTVMASTPASFDAESISWPYAGLYRYKVTETSEDTDDWNMNYDESWYEMDILVENDGNGGLTIGGITVYDKSGNKIDASASGADDDGNGCIDSGDVNNDDGYSFYFLNVYTPHADFIVENETTGNAADLTRTFEYTVSDIVLPDVKADDQSSTFTVNLDNAKASTEYNGTAVTNGTEITAGTDAKFYLGNGEYIIIEDLPVGTTYKVTESGVTNYTATYVVTEAGVELTAVTGTKAADLAAEGTVKITAANADGENKVVFTNDYEQPTPTGIVLENMPIVAGVACVAALAGVVIGTKKLEKKEEES